MIIIFIFVGKHSHFKSECSSHHAESTFLCMRLNPRGLTPSKTGKDDRHKDEKGNNDISDVFELVEEALIKNLNRKSITDN